MLHSQKEKEIAQRYLSEFQKISEIELLLDSGGLEVLNLFTIKVDQNRGMLSKITYCLMESALGFITRRQFIVNRHILLLLERARICMFLNN